MNQIGNVLSLFDGISCGRVALQRAGICCANYYASEIDKYAMRVTQHRYPSTIQLGSVIDVTKDQLPKIDLLLGGSPCQGFSFAGKGLNLEDPRSKLFFEYVRILNECQPKYFLLENVRMKKECMDVITEYLQVEPVLINSSLFSAQDRKRLYWTNIPLHPIEDRKIYLKDILHVDPPIQLFLSEEIANRYQENPNKKIVQNKSCVIGRLSKYQGDRVFDASCKASSLSASGGNNGAGSCNLIFDPNNNRLRKLSVTECERLQTLPDEYTNVPDVPTTQRYKTIGNGWTIDVIAHILKGVE
jgi:DNA (cytosine-5)-methyltransferase 3A